MREETTPPDRRVRILIADDQAHVRKGLQLVLELEDILGSITPGKLADTVVLSQDILGVSPEAVKDAEILHTITAPLPMERSSAQNERRTFRWSEMKAKG